MTVKVTTGGNPSGVPASIGAIYKAPELIDLDGEFGDLNIEYKLGGVRFRCFPLDELEFILSGVEKITGEGKAGELKGIPFLEIVQERLKSTYNVTCSLGKAGDWYDSLVQQRDQQRNFTGGSDGSTDSTASVPVPGPTPDTSLPSSKRVKRKYTRRS